MEERNSRGDGGNSGCGSSGGEVLLLLVDAQGHNIACQVHANG